MTLSKVYHIFFIKRYVLLYCVWVTLMCGSLISYASAVNFHPVVIEVIYPGGAGERENIVSFCGKQQFIDANDIYEWNNHFVIYGNGYDTFYLTLKKKFKNCVVKLYHNPFYDFERTRCNSGAITTQLDNIVLTADLVADPKLQQEYLNYHANQFKKWPEVAQGFCNASFQRLLVFKNGRQLMLIISIPKGQSLDKLNPLTTKNNPRVVEWNNLMKKYQEGIPGTKKGEVWVFLKPYNASNHINH
jgi:hypothetical protein